MASFTGV